MSQLSPELAIEPNEPSQEGAFFRVYSPESLNIAKVMLLAHSNRVPVKKRDMLPIVQKLISSTKEYSRSEVHSFYSQAREFLRENFALTLVELPVVKLGLEHESPHRGELMLSSTITGVREMLLANASPTQKRDWGLLCLVVMMIVVNGNGITYSQALECVKTTNLWQDNTEGDSLGTAGANATGSPSDAAEFLASSLSRLLAQRYLEKRVDNSNDNAPPPAEGSTDHENRNVIYYIGPYTQETLPANELKTMILQLQFPHEDIESEVFQQQHEVLIKGLDLKLEASTLRFIKRSLE